MRFGLPRAAIVIVRRAAAVGEILARLRAEESEHCLLTAGRASVSRSSGAGRCGEQQASTRIVVVVAADDIVGHRSEIAALVDEEEERLAALVAVEAFAGGDAAVEAACVAARRLGEEQNENGHNEMCGGERGEHAQTGHCV